ncbi:MAG: flagellar protein [Lachnospiraceae bacterium]|nr:flagellar protein [Lachnospiraceae bacterium]
MALNAQPCKRCGKLFNYVTGDKLCPVCREEMEQKFQEVKAFIREHKNVSMAEVSEECDVQATWIQKWLREGRLELTEDSAITLGCESCGAPIRSGRLCPKCTDKFRSAAGNYIRSNRPEPEDSAWQRSSSAKMRFLQND